MEIYSVPYSKSPLFLRLLTVLQQFVLVSKYVWQYDCMTINIYSIGDRVFSTVELNLCQKTQIPFLGDLNSPIISFLSDSI